MSRSGFFNPDELADKLMRKPEFSQMGLSVTKDRSAADLVIEVDRIPFSTRFPYVIVDPGNRTVVGSGQVTSLFGTATGKIATEFMKQLKAARAP